MRHSLSVAVAALVVLAGCPGVGTQSSSETVTPAPVPTTEVSYPPGVDGDDVTPSALADAHDRRLRATNFTLVDERRVVGANGTLLTTRRTSAVADGGESYATRYEQSVSGYPFWVPVYELQQWTNGSALATRRTVPDMPTTYGWSENASVDADVTGATVVERLLVATDPSVLDRPEGAVLVASTARRPGKLPTLPYLSAPRAVSLTVQVGDDGTVTRWQLAYNATVGNQTVQVVRETRVTNVGSTTVDRPGWVDRATRSRFG